MAGVPIAADERRVVYGVVCGVQGSVQGEAAEHLEDACVDRLLVHDPLDEITVQKGVYNIRSPAGSAKGADVFVWHSQDDLRRVDHFHHCCGKHQTVAQMVVPIPVCRGQRAHQVARWPRRPGATLARQEYRTLRAQPVGGLDFDAVGAIPPEIGDGWPIRRGLLHRVGHDDTRATRRDTVKSAGTTRAARRRLVRAAAIVRRDDRIGRNLSQREIIIHHSDAPGHRAQR